MAAPRNSRRTSRPHNLPLRKRITKGAVSVSTTLLYALAICAVCLVVAAPLMLVEYLPTVPRDLKTIDAIGFALNWSWETACTVVPWGLDAAATCLSFLWSYTVVVAWNVAWWLLGWAGYLLLYAAAFAIWTILNIVLPLIVFLAGLSSFSFLGYALVYRGGRVLLLHARLAVKQTEYAARLWWSLRSPTASKETASYKQVLSHLDQQIVKLHNSQGIWIKVTVPSIERGADKALKEKAKEEEQQEEPEQPRSQIAEHDLHLLVSSAVSAAKKHYCFQSTFEPSFLRFLSPQPIKIHKPSSSAKRGPFFRPGPWFEKVFCTSLNVPADGDEAITSKPKAAAPKELFKSAEFQAAIKSGAPFVNKCLGTGEGYRRFMKSLLAHGKFRSVGDLLQRGRQTGLDNNSSGGDYFWAYHGTPSVDNATSIMCGGFDTKRRSGQAYGPGEYFDIDGSYATGYHRHTGGVMVCLVLNRGAAVVKAHGSIRVVNNPLTPKLPAKQVQIPEAQAATMTKTAKKRLRKKLQATADESAAAAPTNDNLVPTYCLPVLALPASANQVCPSTGVFPPTPCFSCSPTCQKYVQNNSGVPPSLQYIGDTGNWESCSQSFSVQFYHALQQAKASAQQKFTVGQWEYDCTARTQRNLATNRIRQLRLLHAGW